MKSKLDPEIYGPAESAITTEIVEREIRGFNTVEEVCCNARMVIINYFVVLTDDYKFNKFSLKKIK